MSAEYYRCRGSGQLLVYRAYGITELSSVKEANEAWDRFMAERLAKTVALIRTINHSIYGEVEIWGPVQAVRSHGWHWWTGVGNSVDTEGKRKTTIERWVVQCWIVGTNEGYASSARWVQPLKQSEMGGQWGSEIIYKP